MKNNTSKITFCAMMAALATVVMLLAYFPYLTYALPAISGLFIMLTVIETDCKWAVITYLCSAVLVFLFCEIESKLMYIGLLGYYPILKSVIERIKKPIIEWILKLAVYSSSILIIYFILTRLTDISVNDMGVYIKYGSFILFFAGMLVFILYDYCISRMAAMYLTSYHNKIGKYFK